MIEIAPSILSADFTRLAEEIATVEKAGASILHVDVMDGRFVPNITVGLPVVKAIAKVTRLPIDAHLMIVEPGQYADKFAKAGARMVSIHIEADANAHRTLSSIRAAGALAGIVINPGTSLAALDEIIKFADYVLVMSVNPGFGGQSFIAEALPKLAAARSRIDAASQRTGRPIQLEVDGGVKVDNIADAAKAGADTFVAGSAIFGTPDYKATIATMRAKLAGAR